jgi:hypothetical protein
LNFFTGLFRLWKLFFLKMLSRIIQNSIIIIEVIFLIFQFIIFSEGVEIYELLILIKKCFFQEGFWNLEGNIKINHERKLIFISSFLGLFELEENNLFWLYFIEKNQILKLIKIAKGKKWWGNVQIFLLEFFFFLFSEWNLKKIIFLFLYFAPKIKIQKARE